MLINGIDITAFKAMLLKKNIQTAEVTTYDDWLRNALNPLYMGKQEKYKQIKVQFLIQDIDNDSAINDISNIVKQLEACTIKFDDLSLYYDCLMVNSSNEKIINGDYTLDVELKSGYAYKAAVTEVMNGISSKAITVSGNLNTPVVITITPAMDIGFLSITGFADSITINNLHANKPVVIDGEACTVLEQGVNKFADADMWEFPVLVPGVNTITVDTTNCTIQIQYKPKWL